NDSDAQLDRESDALLGRLKAEWRTMLPPLTAFKSESMIRDGSSVIIKGSWLAPHAGTATFSFLPKCIVVDAAVPLPGAATTAGAIHESLKKSDPLAIRIRARFRPEIAAEDARTHLQARARARALAAEQRSAALEPDVG